MYSNSSFPSTGPWGGLIFGGAIKRRVFCVASLGGLYLKGLIFGILRYSSSISFSQTKRILSLPFHQRSKLAPYFYQPQSRVGRGREVTWSSGSSSGASVRPTDQICFLVVAKFSCSDMLGFSIMLCFSLSDYIC